MCTFLMVNVVIFIVVWIGYGPVKKCRHILPNVVWLVTLARQTARRNI